MIGKSWGHVGQDLYLESHPNLTNKPHQNRQKWILGTTGMCRNNRHVAQLVLAAENDPFLCIEQERAAFEDTDALGSV